MPTPLIYKLIYKFLLVRIPIFSFALIFAMMSWGSLSFVYADTNLAKNSSAAAISNTATSATEEIAKVKQQDLNARLLMAAQRGDVEEVRSLISQATDVNVRDQYGWTPLLWAAMNGHTAVVQVLLVSGANPNTRNRYEWTPLMWAAGQGYDEIVRSLIAFGARLNAQDRNGWTALMWARDGQQKKVVSILQNAVN
ncbi:MAG: ankyrin repeat domain-containing protein [Pseudanabaenaceae cyanobacterium bins.39]|nr:ankyrin repeat domain-containing protein [Pseudanabaenaceae cyanobacterium bins.39]